MAQMALSFSGSLSTVHKGAAEASSIAKLIQSSEIGVNVSVNVAGIQISNDRLSVAESSRFVAELRGLEAARSKIAAGALLLQVADAGLADISTKLGELADLAAVAARSGLSDVDRAQIDQEFQALKADVDVIANNTQFNAIDLLQGGAAPGSGQQVDIRTGTSNGAGNVVSLIIASAKVADPSAGLGAGGVSTQAAAFTAKTDVAAAQGSLNNIRAGIKGDFARLEMAAGNSRLIDAGVDRARFDLVDPEAAADVAFDTARLVSDAQNLDLFKGADQQAQNAMFSVLARQTTNTQPLEAAPATVRTDGVEPAPTRTKSAPAVKSAPASAPAAQKSTPAQTAPEPQSDG